MSKIVEIAGGRKSLVSILALVAITILASIDKLDVQTLTAIDTLVALFVGSNVIAKKKGGS